MLKTRVITAVVLLAVLLPVLYFNNYMAFAVVATVFFGAAIWECFRLFNPGTQNAHIIAILWAAVFGIAVWSGRINPAMWAALGMALWIARFVPSLFLGLPPLGTGANTLLSVVYGCAVVGCFAAIVDLFSYSPLYLLSVMAIVWVADIGAYFSGKTFGKHKLAPKISPGKSWEGAVGGCVAVLVLASLSVAYGGPLFANTFAVRVEHAFGWPALLSILVILVAFSIAGDLFESQLKRRAGMKDSSNLLPGHGGVLDRIDALIPVLPLAALIGARL